MLLLEKNVIKEEQIDKKSTTWLNLDSINNNEKYKLDKI